MFFINHLFFGSVFKFYFTIKKEKRNRLEYAVILDDTLDKTFTFLASSIFILSIFISCNQFFHILRGDLTVQIASVMRQN